jgi:putative endonuclease
MKRGGAVYIMTNKYKTTLYVGVTSDLVARVIQQKTKAFPESFTSKYNLNQLVYFEVFHDIEEAILREKQLKGGSRKKKEELISSLNPSWRDLFGELE